MGVFSNIFNPGVFNVAPQNVYSITGNAGIANASVSYTGTQLGVVYADGLGNYTIIGLAPGTYILTPSLAGYSFSPRGSTQTIVNVSISGVNFQATPLLNISSVPRGPGPAVIVYLRNAPGTNDMSWDINAELTNLQAVEQAIYTRLFLLQGEWWEDLTNGLPLFQQILGYRKSKGNQQAASLAITARIRGTPYVSSVTNIVVTFNPTNRLLTYVATVQTAFGTVTINFTPGAAAGTVNN